MIEKKIIDGKKVANIVLDKLYEEVQTFKRKVSITPKLCIIQVGNNAASNLYIKNKISRANSLNMDAICVNYSCNITESELINNINKYNQDSSIHGIIVQLPLPDHINVNNIASSISPQKDVDGFHPANLGYLARNEDKGFVPCTALACLHLLKYYLKNIESKNIVVIGRSNIVGKPLSILLTNNNATVTLCHSYTKNLRDLTRLADIVISAVGSARLFDSSYFNDNSVIIDVGISNSSDGLIGDINFGDVVNKVKLISPVPGGVGPMTVAYLMHNLYQAAQIFALT